MTITADQPATRRALGATLLATVLVVTTVAFGVTGSARAVGSDPTGRSGSAVTPVVEGSADWGVKASFRTYITGPIASGSIAVSEGAAANAGGTFHFVPAGGQVDGAAVDASFGGKVRFTGHAGALDMTITELGVTRIGTTGSLTADVVSRRLDTGAFVTYDDVVFATLDYTSVAPSTSGPTVTYSAVPATLTAAGATAFADFYATGTALDPITFTLTSGVEATSTTTTAGEATTTTIGATTTSTVVPSTTTTTSAPSTTSTTTGSPGQLPHGTRTATGPDGQTLTVTPTDDLDPDGADVRVVGSGYDISLGIYLTFCVDRGPDVAPSPCLGGADLSGTSTAAVWISSNPPPYGVGLATPFGPGGSFDETLHLTALATDVDGNTIADCFAEGTRCVVTTRADHTNSAERRADVKVPLYFVGQEAPTDPDAVPGSSTVTLSAGTLRPGDPLTVSAAGFLPGEQVEVWLHSEPQWIVTGTAAADGAVSATFDLPADLPAGTHHIELVGVSSGRTLTSEPFTVLAGPTAPTSGTLPVTGAGLGLLALGAVLLAAGGLLLLASGRLRRPDPPTALPSVRRSARGSGHRAPREQPAELAGPVDARAAR